MREAAVVPLAFITAWEGLVDRMAVHAGQSVRVLGGAGGVGRVAIQIARAREADVSATGYPSDQAAIERLGGLLGDRTRKCFLRPARPNGPGTYAASNDGRFRSGLSRPRPGWASAAQT